jgi:hypothetical protein
VRGREGQRVLSMRAMGNFLVCIGKPASTTFTADDDDAVYVSSPVYPARPSVCGGSVASSAAQSIGRGSCRARRMSSQTTLPPPTLPPPKLPPSLQPFNRLCTDTRRERERVRKRET